MDINEEEKIIAAHNPEKPISNSFWLEVFCPQDMIGLFRSNFGIFLLRKFCCPQDMMGLLRSNFGIFLLRKFGVVGVLYWSARGCYLAAHSSFHASFILRRELTRFQLTKGFLGLRIVECRNSSDIQIGNITLIAPNHL